MDDRPEWELALDRLQEVEDERYEPLTPREALEFLRRRSLGQPRGEPGSAAHKHWVETGHAFAFGCCSRGDHGAAAA